MNIISEYEQVLIGNQSQISSSNFIFDDAANERIALHVFRFALEKLLGWNPQESLRHLSLQVIKDMRLKQLLNYIQLPSELTKEDTEYIVHLLYPKVIPYNFSKYVIRTYQNVMSGKMKYPKDYMFGNKGLLRAGICLQHVLQEKKLFHSVQEMYEFFACPEGFDFLKENKLYQLYRSFYDTPVEYLHYSIPDKLKDDFLFHFYLFSYRYRIRNRVLPWEVFSQK